MNPVTIRKTVIGAGMPKICLPIVGSSIPEIVRQAERFSSYHCDLAEWRIDWFDGVDNPAQIEQAAHALRDVLGDIPLLMTFRTLEEGGQRSISADSYIALYALAAEQHLADAIDVELFRGDEQVSAIIEQAHAHQIAVIVSNHNFTLTPPQEEIVARLERAQALGGDILKIAVMPQNAQDVLTLLSATEQAHRRCSQPLITMSMGQLGAVSRIAGETFGSAVTFGAAGAASAPGQLAADDLYTILCTLHGKKD
ncbi:MAG: type I 3-dehydroquinate dehydratase [Butyricicoccus sp.]